MRRRRIAAAGVTAAALLAAGLIAEAGPAAAMADVIAHPITVSPRIEPVLQDPGAVHYGCQDRPITGSNGARCYQPAQIQAAYGLTSLLGSGMDGSGRTIVIIDAFQNPYVQTDLLVFDQTFGLPAADFRQIALPGQGLTAFDPHDPTQVGWAEEISLDVLWAHAAAPGAKIVLALAKSNDDTDIYNITKYVVDHNLGDVISQSFGEAETCMDPTLLAQEHALFVEAKKKRITVLASSGDSGAAQSDCAGKAAILAPSTPASDPLVTGVGGTTLDADTATGVYRGETAWTEPLFGCNPPASALADVNCSGGGFSTIYSRPRFQAAEVKRPHRGVPDVAYDAGINGGLLTHCGICNASLGIAPDAPVFFSFGGTSAGSPQWAGIVAIGDQLGHHRLGYINRRLYAIARSRTHYAAAFHDVTAGSNDVSEIKAGYDADRGWDPVTGLGTPDAAELLPLLSHRTR